MDILEILKGIVLFAFALFGCWVWWWLFGDIITNNNELENIAEGLEEEEKNSHQISNQ